MKKCARFVMEYDSPADRGDIDFGKEKSLTRQADAEECNIEVVLQRCAASNEMLFPKVQPMYVDFTGVEDFVTQQNRRAKFIAAFEMQPAKFREKFSNDPAVLVEFMADPKNRKECFDLGIFVAPKDYVWDEKANDM